MPALTDTLKECFVPYCGISMHVITGINHCLVYAPDLMTEYKGQYVSGFYPIYPASMVLLSACSTDIP